MVRKGEMKRAAWIAAYEDRNVDIGLACGLPGRAQIGKGMWAAPDLMAAMLASKIGASDGRRQHCAWVPSPTAATLHATHYHRVDVSARAGARSPAMKRPARLDDLLTMPVAGGPNWSAAEMRRGGRQQRPGHPRLCRALGRPGHRLFQGARHPRRRADGGPRHLPDLQPALANWLRHGVVTRGQVHGGVAADGGGGGRAERRRPGLPADGAGFRRRWPFRRRCDLVLRRGAEQPSGYTEPILHARAAGAEAAGRAGGVRVVGHEFDGPGVGTVLGLNKINALRGNSRDLLSFGPLRRHI